MKVPFSHLFLLAVLSSSLTAGADVRHDADIQARVQAARSATGDLLKRLGGTLKQEMSKNGPDAAIKVCRDAAPAIASDISLQHGWKVTRVSNKPRNAMLGMPDAWEQGVLQAFEKRAADGEKYKTMDYYEVVDEPQGKSLRYMKAIGTAPLCLSCHGDSKQMSPAVYRRIKTLYPHDRATGFKVGDLRGAVSIKQPLDN